MMNTLQLLRKKSSLHILASSLNWMKAYKQEEEGEKTHEHERFQPGRQSRTGYRCI